MIPLPQLLLEYKNAHHALPAFNVDSFEIFQAVEAAVKESSLPCIVQLSANEDKFITAEKLLVLVKKANIEGLPIYLNMDHGNDLSRLETVIRYGFDMVHFDGSRLAYDENLSKSTEFISHAKSINPALVVEVEFDHINLIEKGVHPGSFTDPQKALGFVNASKADLLAVSVGNLHGVSTSHPEHIDIDLLAEISQTLPDRFFTLHGGSGIPSDQIKSAIDLGIVKININTDLRLQFKKSLIEAVNSSDSERVYDYLTPAIDSVKEVVLQKLTSFAG